MGTVIKIPFKPHPGQSLVLNDTHRFKTLICARRWGKTVKIVNKLQRAALTDAGMYGYVAPTYSQAKLVSWELLKYYAVKGIYKRINESELFIEYINGGIVRLFGADNPDRMRGVKFKGLAIDEFADIKRGVWDLILRPTLADYRGWCDFVGTPKGKNNHLYEMYIRDPECADPNYRDINGNPIDPDPDFKSFRFKTEDNPYIDKREIEKARQELAPAYFAQEWEASFENYTGIIYKEFEDRHIIKPIEIKPYWKVTVSIDTGRHTAVSFIAVDERGVSYVFDEIYDYDGLVVDITTQIKHKLAKIGRKTAFFIIDSASQVKREYEKNGIVCADSYKDVDNQIAAIRNKFASNMLYFFDNCTMHIVEHKGYVWNERARKPEPVKENDHAVNALQYSFSVIPYSKAPDPKEAEYKKSLEYAFKKAEQNKGNWSV